MSIPQEIVDEIETLVLVVDAGESTDDERHRLADLLAKYPDASRVVAELLDQQAALADAGRSVQRRTPMLQLPRLRPTADAPSATTVDAQKKNSTATQNDLASRYRPFKADKGSKPRSLWRFAPAIAASLLLTHLAAAGLGWFAMQRDGDRVGQVATTGGISPAESRDDPPPAMTAPQLVAMTGCVWEPSEGLEPSVGQSLDRGQVLNLQEGIAVLEIGREGGSSNAKLRIDGPAQLLVRDDGLLEFSFGTLTADVRDFEDEFVIVTSEGRVALTNNASFGIVAASERSEVHIFAGKATVLPSWADHRGPIAQLHAGEAVAILSGQSGEPSVTRFEASPVSFVSSRSMAADELDFSGAYHSAILRAKPAVYWRFEEGDTVVKNEGDRVGLDGFVGGTVTWHHSENNRAIEFGLSEISGLVVSRDVWPSEPLDNYSIEFWAKPSHFHLGTMVSLVGELTLAAQSPVSMLVEIGGPTIRDSDYVAPNGIRFLHQDPMSLDPTTRTSCQSISSYSVRKWQHFVARCEAKQLELFVDGKVVASGHSSAPLPEGTRVLVGQLYPTIDRGPQGTAYRPYVGQIDELSLYERALSVEEIRRHCELARPTVAGGDSI